MIFLSVSPVTRQTLMSTFLALLPDGGQRGARRNAWAGMVGSASTARARREAEAALRVAGSRAERPAAERALTHR